MIQLSFEESEVESLLEQSNYRDFLAEFFRIKKAKNSAFSFTVFNRKAGFSSRSTIKDIIDGRRRLTSSTLPQVLDGMELNELFSTYFVNLVATDEADVQSPKLSTMSVDKLANKVRWSLKPVDVDESLFENPNVPLVYCALGDQFAGKSISQIQRLTGLTEKTAKTAIDFLTDQQIVYSVGDRYLAKNIYLSVSNNKTGGPVHNFYLNSLKELYSKAEQEFKSSNTVFNTSDLMIREKDMPDFRNELLELLDKFLVEKENGEEGDALVRIVLGMYQHSKKNN